MTQPDHSATGSLSLHEVDRLVARYVWLERRRFEILGAWVTSVPEPEVAAMLAAQSRHHAWHASLWERHLPRRSGYQGLVEPAAVEALSAFLDAVAQPEGQAETAVRLSGAFRVLGTEVRASYSAQLARTNTVSDAAWARTLRLVLADQCHDAVVGEQALSSLLTDAHQLALVKSHQGELRRRLRDAGGIMG